MKDEFQLSALSYPSLSYPPLATKESHDEWCDEEFFSQYVQSHIKPMIPSNSKPSEKMTLCCSICRKDLSEAEKNSLKPEHFIFTCAEHRKYANYYQIWKIQKSLGIPYVKPKAKCEICDSPITDDELECVDMGQMIITCENHIQHMYSCNLFQVKKDLGYSK